MGFYTTKYESLRFTKWSYLKNEGSHDTVAHNNGNQTNMRHKEVRGLLCTLK